MTNKFFSITISAMLACSLLSAPVFAAAQDRGSAPPPASGDRPAPPPDKGQGEHGQDSGKNGGHSSDKDKGRQQASDRGKNGGHRAYGHAHGNRGINRAKALPDHAIKPTAHDRNMHHAPPNSSGIIIINPGKPFNRKFPA